VPLGRPSTISRDDYLKAILEMEQDEIVPISARLSKLLRVTPPAVTAALKRMSRDGYVHVDKRGRIRLTAKGGREAESLVIRHRLAERLLTEVLGMNWAEVHEEAEKLEHGISPGVERLLLKYFGDDGCCPHGNPVRGGLARLKKTRGAVRLAEVRPPADVEFLRVEEDRGLLEFLSNLALFPGQRLAVKAREYDGTMLLHNARKTIHMSESATSRIWVRVT
jgi:DtxR family Mn-dependent transcriptional regulator